MSPLVFSPLAKAGRELVRESTLPLARLLAVCIFIMRLPLSRLSSSTLFTENFERSICPF